MALSLLTSPALTATAWRSALDPASWPTPPKPEGRPAVLVPGFLATDPSLRHLALWLRSGGWATTRSGLPWNVDCMGESVDRLADRLEEAVGAAGHRAVLIGQSRGGIFARALAVRRPDLVASIVTIGSPVGGELSVQPQAWPAIVGVGLLGSSGVPGLFSLRCLRGACCAPVREELEAPLPAAVTHLAIFSRRDEIVDWRACRSPGATNVEVATSHLGMGLDGRVWQQIATYLDHASPATKDRR